ncbi:BIG2 domain-containing protein [Vibrio chagasii]|nr:BIG2 domain-containing protein [Vibrio chagasii]
MNILISAIMTLLLFLLAGCHIESEHGKVANDVKSTITLERIKISASSERTKGTSVLTLAKGNQQAFVAIGYYSDQSSRELTDLNIWRSNKENVGFFVEPGKLIANTLGILAVTATKDGVTSNTVDVEVYACRRTGNQCIDLLDTGSGTLFTNSPSKTFLDSIGSSANDGFTQEIGTSGPTGDFYLFDWNKADLLCDTYNTNNIAGRTNWRLATVNELRGLFNANGNMFTARGWAVRINYWTSTARGPGYYNVSLRSGGSGLTMPGDDTLYASCVSVP